MNSDQQAFERRAVKPMACLRRLALIKDDYWLFLGIMFIGMVLIGAGTFFIMGGPIICGFHICFFRREREQAISFGDFFQGFEFFVPSLIANLIMVVPQFLLLFVSYLFLGAGMFALIAALGQGGPPDPAIFVPAVFSMMGLWMLLLIVGSMAIKAAFLFIYPLIVDRQLSGWQAVVLSFRAVLGNFWGVFWLVLLSELLQIVGFMACFVGLIFVLPLEFALVAVAYRQVFPEKDLGALFDQYGEDDEEYATAPLVLPGDTGIQGSPPTSVTPTIEPERP